MKKVYESPVMMAEAYETNAYCNGCGTRLADILSTNESDGATYKSRNSGMSSGWGNSHTIVGQTITREMLGHTFDNDHMSTPIDGVCGGSGNYCGNLKSSVWTCTCTDHPGETWYLEWSHYYSVHANKKDTFFLYKEYNGTPGLTITPNRDSWPATEGNSDINVAQVTFAKLENLVQNS